MPKQGKTPKKKSKEKTPQKSGESEYPAMDQEELNRLVQNAIEQSQAQLQQKHEEQIKRLEADRKLAEVYQTVHLKEFTDFPKKDEKDPTTVFTDIHFEKKSVAYEAYHLSHGLCLWIDWVDTSSSGSASSGRSRPGGVERETY